MTEPEVQKAIDTLVEIGKDLKQRFSRENSEHFGISIVVTDHRPKGKCVLFSVGDLEKVMEGAEQIIGQLLLAAQSGQQTYESSNLNGEL